MNCAECGHSQDAHVAAPVIKDLELGAYCRACEEINKKRSSKLDALHSFKMPEKRWRTQDGRVLAISDMTDSHLQNSINYFLRRESDDNTEYVRETLRELYAERNRRDERKMQNANVTAALNEQDIPQAAPVPVPKGDAWINRIEIRSESNPELVYIVAQHKRDGYWACTCMGWRTRRKCKHLREMGLSSTQPNMQRATGNPNEWKDAARLLKERAVQVEQERPKRKLRFDKE
jgi:hypothetical protein